MWLKICGVQRPDRASVLAGLALNALGINRYPDSRRFVGRERVGSLVGAIRERSDDVQVVLVYVDPSPDDVREDLSRFSPDLVQLHGDESPRIVEELQRDVPVIKAFRVSDEFDGTELDRYRCYAHLVDAYDPDRYGGTGRTAPWDRIRSWTGDGDRRLILAGGLTPRNIRDAYRRVKPWGLDVCSGVEDESGCKDLDQVRTLLQEVRDAR